MKILNLQAENVKKLSVVEITPEGNLVEIAGKNGAGKSSVLDSIWWALAGASHIQAKPIREGAKRAVVKLDLGDVKVERRFTAGGNELRVTNEKGARYPSPQKMLDDLVGALSFDPLAFTRMKPLEQHKAIKAIVDLDVDLDELESLNKWEFDERTDVNREVKSLKAQIEAIDVDEDLSTDPVDISGLMDELQGITEQESALATWERNLKEKIDLNYDLAEEVTALKNKIKSLEESIDEGAANIEKYRKEKPETPADPSDIREKIAEGEKINKNAERKAEKDELEGRLDVKQALAAKLSASIEDRKQVMSDAVAAADMPVDGLAFGDGEILLDGLPFDQASSAQQLRASVAIAMRTNPTLRVIRIQDGSLLDADAMQALREAADGEDFQIWIERVEASDDMAIIMEDGHVQGVETVEEEAGS